MEGQFFRARFGTFLFWLVILAVKGFIVMILWNLLMPRLFELPGLHYLEATGLMFLADLLFGRRNYNKWFHGHSVRKHFKKKYESMSMEERRCFKQLLQKIHGCAQEDVQPDIKAGDSISE